MIQELDNFNGLKLKEAREFNEFTQTKLAELIKVKKQTISALEKSKQSPSSDNVLKLSDVLGFPFNFFFYKTKENNRISPITFRGKANNTKRKKIKAELYDRWFSQIVNYISEFIDFPQYSSIFSAKYDCSTLDKYDLDSIADEIREQLNIGFGPISNLVNLMEGLGIFLGVTDLPTQIDAFSSIYKDYSCIYMNYTANKAARIRFNLAHEFGHLLLHRNIDQEYYDENFVFIEKQANLFASAFLLPKKAFLKEFFSLDLNSLLRLKQRWKVSIQAIIKRAKTLELITENQYQNSFRRLNYKGYRKVEPLDDQLEVEKPYLLNKSIDLIISSNIKSKNQIVEDIGLPGKILSKLINKESSYFSNDSNIINFNLKLKDMT